ncbi:hypothetical protein Leryth_010899 [Lithospermum erythrorhizon]|uniref:Defense/immunity protein n=1 Tax=Lithospermum erythrorhizon TaxID=34254 RepID=A0AAV3P987_LITER|nr:hypothetical protein Leryth_010899 [Lithospermum erythrorhizon]
MGSILGFLQAPLLLLLLLVACHCHPCISIQDSKTEVSSQNLHRRLLSSTTPKKQVHQYLMAHNKVRAQLKLPKLQWSEKLARYANSWAHQLSADCELRHSNTDYGENLFWGTGTDWKLGDAVVAWATEKVYYNHSSNSCIHNQECLHYTQLVWKQSRKVGCARVTCNGDTIISCNYYPHGNVVGERPF